MKLNPFIDFTYITEKVARIESKNCNDISQIIEKFDQGHQSIVVEENGIFKGLIDINIFREQFGGQITLLTDAFLPYAEDEEINKKNAAEIFSRSILREIPFLKNNKAVAVAINIHTVGMPYKLNETEFPPIYWNLINEESMKVFNFNKKILISSEFGNLKNFKNKFDNDAIIETLNNENLLKYMNGYYDLFIFGSFLYKFSVNNMNGGG